MLTEAELAALEEQGRLLPGVVVAQLGARAAQEVRSMLTNAKLAGIEKLVMAERLHALQVWSGALQERHDALLTEHIDMAKEVVKLRACIEAVEFDSGGGYTDQSCLWCGKDKAEVEFDGHKAECQRQAALGKAGRI